MVVHTQWKGVQQLAWQQAVIYQRSYLVLPYVVPYQEKARDESKPGQVSGVAV